MTSGPGGTGWHDPARVAWSAPPAPSGGQAPPPGPAPRAPEGPSSDAPSGPPPGPPGGHGEAPERDHWSLAQKLVALLTAILTLATAALGLWGAKATSERDDLQERSDGLAGELATAEQERDAALGELETAEARIAELESTDVADTSETTPITSQLGGPVEGEPTYLADLESVDGAWVADDDLKIDGTTQLHGVRSNTISGCPSADAVHEVEYSIDRGYTTFGAVVGVSDESISGLPVEIAIRGDGRELWRQTVQVGTPQAVELDVTGILRLRVIATRLFEVSTCNDRVFAALGDPALE